MITYLFLAFQDYHISQQPLFYPIIYQYGKPKTYPYRYSCHMSEKYNTLELSSSSHHAKVFLSYGYALLSQHIVTLNILGCHIMHE